MRVKYTRTTDLQNVPNELSKLVGEATVQIRQVQQLAQSLYAHSCIEGKVAECASMAESVRKVLYSVDTMLSDVQEMADGYISAVEQEAVRLQEALAQKEASEEVEETQTEDSNDQID